MCLVLCLRMILKWNLQKYGMRMCLTQNGGPVAGFCEHGNVLSRFLASSEFPAWLSGH
jgi:hypothetical protein